MFEADVERFRIAGIRIGADQTDVEASLMNEMLAPFPVDLRNRAMRMTRLYALIYCFENSVRQLVKERLELKYQGDWWEKGVPKKIRDYADNRMEKAESQLWLEGEKGDPLQYVDFGGLSDIIVGSWDEFSDLIDSQHWLKQRMDEIEQARNFIAHNRLLRPGEFARLEQYVRDWQRQVSF